MNILYRLTEDNNWLKLLEGSCLTEGKYKQVYYLDKISFEEIQDFERKNMIEYKDDEYMAEKGIEAVLFYTQKELEKFMEKL